MEWRGMRTWARENRSACSCTFVEREITARERVRVGEKCEGEEPNLSR